MQGASNFKPFALLAAVREGISTKTKFDGDSPSIDGTQVTNFGQRSRHGRHAPHDGRSINTAFVNLNKEVTRPRPGRPRSTAGIPAKTPGLDDTLTNVLGTASPHVIDMASAYSTIASQGAEATLLRHEGHLDQGDFNYEVDKQTTGRSTRTSPPTSSTPYTSSPAARRKLRSSTARSRARPGPPTRPSRSGSRVSCPSSVLGRHVPRRNGVPQPLDNIPGLNVSGSAAPASRCRCGSTS